MLMIPEHTSVKVDNPESEWHGETGFVLYNHRSGIVEPCDECQTKEECKESVCENGFELPKNWYVLIFDPTHRFNRP